MRQEAAKPTPTGAAGSFPAAGGSPPPPVPDRPGPPAPAQQPMFTASTDPARGTVRVRGRLDRIGADLVVRGVLALQQAGHRRITVELPGPAALDAGARRLLDDLAQRLWAHGVQLVLR